MPPVRFSGSAAKKVVEVVHSSAHQAGGLAYVAAQRALTEVESTVALAVVPAEAVRCRSHLAAAPAMHTPNTRQPAAE